MKEWYTEAISKHYGHLLIDLIPKTVDSLKFFTSSGSILSKCHLPAESETKFSDNEHTMRLYTLNNSKTIHPPIPKKIHSVPQRMSSKFATRQATGSPKTRLSKISKRNIRTHTMEIFTDQRKTNLSSPILYNKPLKRYKTLKLKVVDRMRISKNDIFFERDTNNH